MHTGTHACAEHTHQCRHVYMCTRMYMHTQCAYMHACTHTHHTCVHTCEHVHAHTDTCHMCAIRIYAHAHAHACTHMPHTCAHMHTCLRMPTHVCVHITHHTHTRFAASLLSQGPSALRTNLITHGNHQSPLIGSPRPSPRPEGCQPQARLTVLAGAASASISSRVTQTFPEDCEQRGNLAGATRPVGREPRGQGRSSLPKSARGPSPELCAPSGSE